MIWPNFTTASPEGIGRVAILWPIGTARATVTPSASSTRAGRQRGRRDDDVVARMQPDKAAGRGDAGQPCLVQGGQAAQGRRV